MRTMQLRRLAAAIVMTLSPLASAATAPTSVADEPVTQLNTTAENKGQTQVATRIASSFGKLAGSDANTLKLVQALRNGTPVTLTTTSTSGTGTGTGTSGGTTTTTTITPPTGKMGWGNVFISLALAKDALARAGISNPTTAQLQAALVGGDVTGADGKTVTLKGVLQMRADGMGWGQIAQAQGTKLGPVVSSIKSAHAKVAALPAASGTTAPSTAAATASKGVSTAEGTGGVHGGKATKGVTTASGVNAGTVTAAGHSANAPGRGVVNAAGVSATPGVVTHGNSGNHTQGVLNASGGITSGVNDAGGQGKGNAGGNGKGKGGS